jgi:hypothetical protein
VGKGGGRHNGFSARVLAIDRWRDLGDRFPSRRSARDLAARPRGDRSARDMAEHRMARSRGRRLQEARDRHEPTGHRSRRATAAAAVIRGYCEFTHTGTLPVAEEVLKGRDIVILATPTSQFPNSFVMTRQDITQLAQLNGKKVGVLTETGQTSVAARFTVEKAGATATYLPLIKFDRIYTALASGEIDAGALPIDLRFAGEVRYGWNAFPIHEFGTPSIFASTRKLIAFDRALMMDIMQGFVETIHLFKTRPDVVVPLLQRYLNIDDRKAAEELYAFHVPVFQKIPRPSFPGIQTLRELLVAKYPAAVSLKESDIADSSFIDELERQGFIDRLYASDAKKDTP